MPTDHWDVKGTGVDPQHRRYAASPSGTTIFPAAMYFAAARPGVYSVAPRIRFERLAHQWRSDVMHLSSPTQMAMHDCYQMIIGMGPTALPFILEELRDRGGQWYWALRAIAEHSPISPGAAGNIPAMRDAWLQWGVEHGYILPV